MPYPHEFDVAALLDGATRDLGRTRAPARKAAAAQWAAAMSYGGCAREGRRQGRECGRARVSAATERHICAIVLISRRPIVIRRSSSPAHEYRMVNRPSVGTAAGLCINF